MPSEQELKAPSRKQRDAFELRRSRYLGLAKTRLQHLFTAIAINLVRFDAWLNKVPHAKTRTSRFAALAVANAR